MSILAFGVWVQSAVVMASFSPVPAFQAPVPVNGSVQILVTAADSTPDPADVETGIAWVELYLDGVLLGQRQAASTLTYAWDTRPVANGAHTLTAKASDNAGNIGNSPPLPVTIQNTASDVQPPVVTVTVTVAGTTKTIWPAAVVPANSVPDVRGLELGLKFKADVTGQITGIRFYKGPENTGPHAVSLWTSAGVLLNSALSSGETATGWQQVNFATPTSIAAGVTYVASYHTLAGYSWNCPYFTAPYDAPPLHALGALYVTGPQSVFPSLVYSTCNWWVDVVFN